MAEKRVTYICPKCGSDNIGRDATAYWSDEEQTWELGGLHDVFYCNGCGAELREVDEKELTDE